MLRFSQPAWCPSAGAIWRQRRNRRGASPSPASIAREALVSRIRGGMENPQAGWNSALLRIARLQRTLLRIRASAQDLPVWVSTRSRPFAAQPNFLAIAPTILQGRYRGANLSRMGKSHRSDINTGPAGYILEFSLCVNHTQSALFSGLLELRTSCDKRDHYICAACGVLGRKIRRF